MKKLALIFLILIGTGNLYAETTVPVDSTRVYKLGEIFVTSDKIIESESPSSISKLTRAELQKSDAMTFQDLNALIPSSNISKNSRGEALITIRGMGDRRATIFFDGALLNNQWDRRFDLSLLPTDLISKITVSNGSASVLYGANSMAGCIDITTAERSANGFGGSLNLFGGNGPYGNLSVMQNGKFDKFNYIVGFSYLDSKGMVLSQQSIDNANDPLNTELINQNKNSRLRTNTDKSLYNAYARAEYTGECASYGLSYMRIGTDFGVAPQGNETSPRFWRTSDYERNLLTFNGKVTTDKENQSSFRSTLWLDNTSMPIDEYTDITFTALDSTVSTLDKMNTYGARLIYDLNPNKVNSLKATATAYYTANTESYKDLSIQAQDYSELIYDAGVEYNYRNESGFIVTAGALLTGQITPKAGAFTDTDVEGKSTMDWGAMVGIKYDLNDNLSAFANASRKVSFPTLRQAYANPPKKFVSNPDLTAETGILTELGLKYQAGKLNLQPVLFYNSFENLLAKKRVADDPLKRSIRINLATASILGAELGFDYNPVNNIKIFGSLTYMKSEGKESPESKVGKLEYVPEFLGYMNVRYSFADFASTQIEVDYLGKQYGLNLAGAFQEIDPSVFINVRLGWMFHIKSTAIVEVFVRCNNLVDTERIQALGLPSAGRTFIAGIKTNI
jgi:iron complex outermembrane recepter protein